MAKSKSLPKVREQDPPDDHDHLEIIRFASDKARLQAIGTLMDHGMLNFTSYRHDESLVRTSFVLIIQAEIGTPVSLLVLRLA